MKRIERGFRRFAELECRGSSPLYELLSLGIAEDRELLELATHARPGQPVHLFFSCVHWLLLTGKRYPVSAFYPSLAQGPIADGDPYPSFRDFCLEHREEIVDLLETRLVQTNVVRRCSVLLPAFAWVARRNPGMPMSVVEVGSSAGLNLLWDRYGYDYGNAERCGDPGSPVQLACTLRGEMRPYLPQEFPKVVHRVGMDLAPVDIRDPEAVSWLRALVWPEHEDRVEILQGAIEIAKQEPPPVLAGDALELLPWVLPDVPPESALCIFHTHTLNQFSREARDRFDYLIQEHGSVRDLSLISVEWLRGEHPAVEVTSFEKGIGTTTHLANSDSHGNWIEWLQA